MNFRNRFLSSSSLLFSPPDDAPAAGAQQQADSGSGDAAGAAGGQDGGDGQQQQTEGSADGAAGDAVGAEGDAAGGSEDPGGGADDDDDLADLADLPPEVRARAKTALDKKLAKEVGWRDRQIDRLYRRSRETQEENRALETIADPQRRTPAAGAAGQQPQTFTAEDVQREAQRLTAQQQYDRDANDADQRGRTSYGDKWGTTIAKLPKLGGVEINDMVDILNTDQPHVVLFQLADPDTYERVMALPPARRRNEYVKLAMKEAPKVTAKAADSLRPSGATPPVAPLAGGRRVAAQQTNLYDDKAGDDAWYAERNRTRRKKFSNAD